MQDFFLLQKKKILERILFIYLEDISSSKPRARLKLTADDYTRKGIDRDGHASPLRCIDLPDLGRGFDSVVLVLIVTAL